MKKIITMSLVVASMAMAGGNVNSDLQAQIDALKAEIATLKNAKTETVAVEQKSGESEDRIAKLEEKVSEIKKHDSGDNIKFDVDFRTAVDSIDYKMADGVTKAGKNDLFSNRLWLNMAYAPTDNVIFKGQLAAHKAFGADFGVQNSGLNTNGTPQRTYGMDSFDWVTNETLTDSSIKLRQAYWLYMSDDFMGTEIPWTMSVGRRPSTAGFLSNIREDDAAQSPLGHIIDVEFDGASSKFSFGDKVGVPGMALKFCLGQGSTNASPRFSRTQTDYANDSASLTKSLKDVTLGGIVFTPYDDGQFKLETTAFRGANLPGYDGANMGLLMDLNPNNDNTAVMSTLGDIDGAAASLLVDGLDDDNEFLSNTKVFASYAMSKTRPDAGQQMLGSTASETGTSYWLGTQFPVEALGGKLGLEYNHGSKYWRSFTYGEDTMAGSKLATRGDAYEAHYTQPITEALSAQLRYTKMNYDYTGSNSFFGAEGTPMTMAQAVGAGMGASVVESAEDIRAYIRYRY